MGINGWTTAVDSAEQLPPPAGDPPKVSSMCPLRISASTRPGFSHRPPAPMPGSNVKSRCDPRTSRALSCHEFLDVSQAQGKPEVPPHAGHDYRWFEPALAKDVRWAGAHRANVKSDGQMQHFPPAAWSRCWRSLGRVLYYHVQYLNNSAVLSPKPACKLWQCLKACDETMHVPGDLCCTNRSRPLDQRRNGTEAAQLFARSAARATWTLFEPQRRHADELGRIQVLEPNP
jgi:hypothetical protein